MIPLRHLISPEALRRYDDDGEPVYTTHERVLMALRWFDWCTAERLCEAVGIDINEPAQYQERQKYSSALAYWHKRGRVEKRHDRGVVEYRLLPVRRWGDAVQCVRCPADRVPGRTMCQRHLDWEREYKQRRRAA